jgi:hypothetical protein
MVEDVLFSYGCEAGSLFLDDFHSGKVRGVPFFVKEGDLGWENVTWLVVSQPDSFSRVLEAPFYCGHEGRDGIGSWVLQA